MPRPCVSFVEPGEDFEVEELLQRQIADMPLAYVLWDRDFCVRAWNPAATRMFGYEEHEAIGRHASFVVSADLESEMETIWRRLMDGDRTAHSVTRNLRKDGRHILCEWTNTPMIARSGRVVGVFSMIADITEKKALEHQAQQASQVEALAAMTGRIAHDFNNLLTTLLGFADVALELLPSDAPARDAIEEVKSAGLHGAELTASLLAFSRNPDLRGLAGGGANAHPFRATDARASTVTFLPPPSGKPAVLIIEDDGGVRAFVRHTFEQAGYVTHSVPTTQAALAIARTHAIDLVVTDILLPDHDGLEILRDLKAARPDVPIVAISGGGRIAAAVYLDLATRLGVAATLIKPFDAHTLLTTAAAVLTGVRRSSCERAR